MTINNSLPIVVVGTGGVARSLLHSLKLNNIGIYGVISRGGKEAMQYLTDNRLHAIDYNTPISEPCLCIIAVPDHLISETAKKICLPEGSILLHTAGSIDMVELSSFNKNYGVLYPLQTLHRLKAVNFKDITLCIESNNDYTKNNITELANKLSNKVLTIDSKQRLLIHMAAVFACNFTNLMYSVSENILKSNNLDFSTLYTLISETTNKALHTSPTLSQTGPAVRNDINTINKHLSLLEGNEKEIYKLLTRIISEKYSKK